MNVRFLLGAFRLHKEYSLSLEAPPLLPKAPPVCPTKCSFKDANEYEVLEE